MIERLATLGFSSIGLERGYFEVKYPALLAEHAKHKPKIKVEGVLAGTNLTYGDRLRKAEEQFFYL
jgi:hypothetical protein